MRTLTVLTLILILAIPGFTKAGNRSGPATLYKTPLCDCCEAYAAYLREHGFHFQVEVVATHDLPLIKRQHGVPDNFEGCHTMLIDGYVVEGHVPVATLNRLLDERPDIRASRCPGCRWGRPA